MVQLLASSAILVFLTMTILWLISLKVNKMSIVDGFWGLGFILLATYHFMDQEDKTPGKFLAAYLIFLWGVRLAAHIFYRNHNAPEDPRYAAWRKDWGKNTWWISYFKVFLLQGVLMLTISLPLIAIMHGSDDFLYPVDWIGVMIWLTGWLFETIGDYQLLRFKKNPANKGVVMDKGLWRYTRHPNYFGETLVWWGIFIISVSSGLWYVSVLSPLLITFLLLKVSGVTLLEKRYDGNDKYAEYKRKTSSFIPLPLKK
ncbi:MAG: DUF1295 domain-containing protein [Chitinophagales bacterium]|nr:DUF1295 domain-containing protein [Chitinophagales bacterium]